MRNIDSSPTLIIYSGKSDRPELMLQKMRRDQARYNGKVVLSILSSAYESHEAFLAKGDARKHFSDRMSVNYSDEIEKSMAQGSSYWLAYGSRYVRNATDIVGVIKTTPVWYRTDRIQAPGGHVDEIAVKDLGRGTGSALLHAASRDFKNNSSLTTDVLAGMDEPGVELFFEKAGFERMSPQPDQFTPFVIGETDLTNFQVRYRAMSVSGLRAALEAHRPWLASGLEITEK